ncbi:MAG TPA: Na+/H+ antiporter NhaA, partial [Saprospiraceae bacterium]|nr:Na+/H+ antiporter NhaA [Saprospiraceae bacterium]
MRATQLFKDFFSSESLGGLLLVAATAIALLVANSAAGPAYADLLHTRLAAKPFEFWVNDGLMTFFFLLVGLEIERELYVGELSERRTALLPVSAAIGGMVVPVLFFAALNWGKPGMAGFGIPMATDIAFALGILSLLGSRVPYTLKVFLTALAIIDDMGAILIISLFYTQGFSAWALGGAGLAFGLMLLLNRMRVLALWPYFLLAVGLWVGLYQAGIHPTVAGILLAFAIPFGDGGERSPSYRLQHALHGPVAYLIMPVFALTNAGIAFSPQDVAAGLGSALGAGIV